MTCRSFSVAGVVLVLFLGLSFADAQEGDSSAAAVPARTLPPPALKSPVETFRKLLALTPEERTNALAVYPPAVRERLKAKLLEYQILPDPLRELRLQSTELRWYLLPLLKMSPSNRVERLKLIPEPYKKLIETRLDEWDLWPPTLKEEVLEYESTMHYLVGRNAEAQPQMGAEALSTHERSELERKLERWKALPQPQRQQMYGAFQRYFELSETEKQRTLNLLSDSQREETEKVLDAFEKWPKAQQDQYIAAFREFASMSDADRQQFLKNAQRWKEMSETERQAWRDLVKQVSEAPPLPIGFVPQPQISAGSPVTGKTNPIAAPVK